MTPFTAQDETKNGAIPTREQVHALYRKAQKADDAFHAEVVRQFGVRRAGDMRYRTETHDAQTRAAGEAYVRASEAARLAYRARIEEAR
jgi:hypothetical protein